MKILFVSNDLIAGNLAYLLKQEGHEVKLYIDSVQQRDNFTGLVDKTDDWEKELEWMGKDGLIVFDDIGYGAKQDALRAKGYNVFGGSEDGDKLESNRQHAQEIFAEYGIRILPIKNFENIPSAIEFIKNNKDAWVIKQNGHASKSFNFVPHFNDSRDAINVLENYDCNTKNELQTVTLQKKVEGVEIGVARYFNGTDWVGPIEMNVEHKKFFPGDLGPTTSEMGTLAWYDDNEDNKLFQETLAKLKPYLQKINYRGDIDIGCIVNETGAYPLEATPRFGSPIIHLHSEIHSSPWGELLLAVAKGESYDLKWRRGYGIIVLVTVPPFPYSKKLPDNSSCGLNIYFDPPLLASDSRHLHFEEVSKNLEDGQYYISDHRGYILYATGMGETVEQAQKETYALVNKVQIPKMFYRHDIGNKFIQESQEKLHEWGYL